VFGPFAGGDMGSRGSAWLSHRLVPAGEVSPAKAHLKTAPHTIKLHFSLRADARYSTIDLEDDDGAVLASKTQQRASRDMDMSAPLLAPGRYHVRYRILSPDGDVVQGKIDFIVDE
jgi:methionine-rich copper-binding protein CopC